MEPIDLQAVLENIVYRSVSRRYTLAQTINSASKTLKRLGNKIDREGLTILLEPLYTKYVNENK